MVRTAQSPMPHGIQEVRQVFASSESGKKPVKPESSQHTEHDASTEGPSVDGDELKAHAAQLAGLTIEEFARQEGIPESEVWSLLRRGKLVARNHRGRLVVFGNPDEVGLEPPPRQDDLKPTTPDLNAELASSPDPASERLIGELSGLPPLPHRSGAEFAGGEELPLLSKEQDGRYLALSGGRTETPEVALLLDHLSLAKEENLQILKMTQESIRKVTELTDSIVEMKDAVIEAKEAQIQALKEQLKAADRQNARLKQENEDLQMLARTLTTQLNEKQR